jgi:flagellar biosynthesis/type III secretory pathway protein FliH
MAGGPVLEDFATLAGPAAQAPSDPAPALADAERLAAYEQGYRAGWDDAVRAEAADQARIGAELARNLQEMSFSFHEARVQVIEAMGPLLTEMTTVLFPGLAREALAQSVWDALGQLVEDAADLPMEIAVAPESVGAVRKRLAEEGAARVSIVEDDTLAAGQARLRAGRMERRVDIDVALAAMRSRLQEYFSATERTAAHG